MGTLVDCPKCGNRSVTTDRTAIEGPRYVCAHCGDVTPSTMQSRRKSEIRRASAARCTETEEMFK